MRRNALLLLALIGSGGSFAGCKEPEPHPEIRLNYGDFQVRCEGVTCTDTRAGAQIGSCKEVKRKDVRYLTREGQEIRIDLCEKSVSYLKEHALLDDSGVYREGPRPLSAGSP